MTEEKLPLCECGCGQEVTKIGNRFITGHNGLKTPWKPKPEAQLCKCGCGELALPGRDYILGHGLRTDRYWKLQQPPKLCKCGCGKYALPGNDYIHGHYNRGKERSPKHCAALSKSHIERKASDETKLAMSIAQKERYEDPKEREKTSKTARGKNNGMYGRTHSLETRSKMVENHADMSGENNPMYGIKGGNDIVFHHYIYDHSDLSKYTMKMTRSRHMRLHNLMRKAGIKVPHINEIEVI